MAKYWIWRIVNNPLLDVPRFQWVEINLTEAQEELLQHMDTALFKNEIAGNWGLVKEK